MIWTSRVLLIIGLVLISCDRSLGGVTEAPPTSQPPPKVSSVKFAFQVALEFNDKQECSGAIINNHMILTAAHCLKDKKLGELTVVTNDDRKYKSFKGMMVHEKYVKGEDTEFDPYDIGMITLNERIDINEKVRSVNILAESYLPKRDTLLTAWGKNTTIFFQVRHACKDIHPNITTSQFCVKKVIDDAECTSDNGGPVVLKEYGLIGIVSYSKSCSEAAPAVIVRVRHLRKWIDAAIQSANSSVSIQNFIYTTVALVIVSICAI